MNKALDFKSMQDLLSQGNEFYRRWKESRNNVEGCGQVSLKNLEEAVQTGTIRWKNWVEQFELECEWIELAHEGQTRENGGPYSVHPIRMAYAIAINRAESKGKNDIIEEDDWRIIRLALWHDVKEDCGSFFDIHKLELSEALNHEINAISNPIKQEGELRKEWKRRIVEHHRKTGSYTHEVKCWDIVDNASEVNQRSIQYRGVFLEEKRALLEVLIRAPKELRDCVKESLNQLEDGLNKKQDIRAPKI